jgi:hypothetical protein
MLDGTATRCYPGRVSQPEQSGHIRPLSVAIAEVDSRVGRERLAGYLAARPFPHFEPAGDAQGVFIKTDDDGTRTRGRFVSREFRIMDEK